MTLHPDQTKDKQKTIPQETQATIIDTSKNSFGKIDNINTSVETMLDTSNNSAESTKNAFQTQIDSSGKQTLNDESHMPALFANKYKIIKVLGTGAMGKVFEAINITNQKKVAIKVIHKSKEGSEEIVKRFLRESKLLQKLTHPGIIKIHAQGSHKEQPYFVMDLVTGSTFTDVLKKKSPMRTKLKILVQALEAVHAAHNEGIVHRDLKPDNIMVTEENKALVMDFGIARDQGDENATKLTQTGMLIGTPIYMSPEQINGEKITFKSDIYSMGVIMYQLLTGKRPFTGNVSKIMWQVTHVEAISPKEISPKTPEDLAIICLKAMNKDKNDRYITARAMANDIKRYFKGEAISVKPDLGWKKYNKLFVILAVLFVSFGFFELFMSSENNTFDETVAKKEKLKIEDALKREDGLKKEKSKKNELEIEKKKLKEEQDKLKKQQEDLKRQKKELEKQKKKEKIAKREKKAKKKKQLNILKDIKKLLSSHKEKLEEHFRDCKKCNKIIRKKNISIGNPPDWRKVPKDILIDLIKHAKEETQESKPRKILEKFKNGRPRSFIDKLRNGKKKWHPRRHPPFRKEKENSFNEDEENRSSRRHKKNQSPQRDEENFEKKKSSFRNRNNAKAKKRSYQLKEVMYEIIGINPRTVVDLGCNSGRLLELLLKEKQIRKILGVDNSHEFLKEAKERLSLHDMKPRERRKIELIHSNFLNDDERIQGYDLATLVNVVEHLDESKKKMFEYTVFEFIQAEAIIITAPLGKKNMHKGQKLSRKTEFGRWSRDIARQYNYDVQHRIIKESLSQISVFRKR